MIISHVNCSIIQSLSQTITIFFSCTSWDSIRGQLGSLCPIAWSIWCLVHFPSFCFWLSLYNGIIYMLDLIVVVKFFQWVCLVGVASWRALTGQHSIPWLMPGLSIFILLRNWVFSPYSGLNHREYELPDETTFPFLLWTIAMVKSQILLCTCSLARLTVVKRVHRTFYWQDLGALVLRKY